MSSWMSNQTVHLLCNAVLAPVAGTRDAPAEKF